MFILYALVIGVAAGLLIGGRLIGLGELRFRWGPVAVIGLAIQVILFSGPITDRIGSLGPPIYMASTAMVLVVLLRNLAIPGLPLVALGAASNFMAIVANGGFMPAAPAALAALGKHVAGGYSNSAVRPDAALAPLTDLFAIPAWVPFANVFSVGDVVIGAGVMVTIVVAMRQPSPAPATA